MLKIKYLLYILNKNFIHYFFLKHKKILQKYPKKLFII